MGVYVSIRCWRDGDPLKISRSNPVGLFCYCMDGFRWVISEDGEVRFATNQSTKKQTKENNLPMVPQPNAIFSVLLIGGNTPFAHR